MKNYSYCGYILESELTLELNAAYHKIPKYKFGIGTSAKLNLVGYEWYHRYHHSDGQTWLRIGRQNSKYILQFYELANFLILTESNEIVCFPQPETTMETIRHLLLDQVIPLILSQQGKTVLHASAVLTKQGVVAFLGDSGWGKSTLSAGFCRQGSPMLTDDCLLVEQKQRQFYAIPSYPGFRLWPDTLAVMAGPEVETEPVAHYTEKKRLSLDSEWLSFHTEAALIQTIFVLAPPNDSRQHNNISITQLTSREALVALLNYSFRLDIGDRSQAKKEFEQLSNLATALHFYQLAVPRDLRLLPDVVSQILDHLEKGNSVTGH